MYNGVIKPAAASCASAIGRERAVLKGCAAETPSVLLIITMNQLRATADVCGGIGRSSEMDRSKVLDLYFPKLHWSSFLGFVGKSRYRNKMTRHLFVF